MKITANKIKSKVGDRVRGGKHISPDYKNLYGY